MVSMVNAITSSYRSVDQGQEGDVVAFGLAISITIFDF